jgi:membrane protein YdbS with pleckstrin-like domain
MSKEKTRSEFKKLKTEIIDKFSTLLTTAFGLVAALAWNGAIQAIFKQIFGTPDAIIPQLTYAVTVTIIAVIATIWISRIAKRLKAEEEEEDK